MFSRGKLMSAAGAALLSGTILVPSSTIYASPAPEAAAAATPQIITAPQIVAAPQSVPVETAVPAPAQEPAEAPKPATDKIEERETERAAVSSRELDCMTKVILYEAGAESRAGQVAVAQVVMNRVESPRFPDSVCGVIYQRGQFSSIRSFRHAKNARWQRAERIARAVMSGDEKAVVGRALYFHATRVRPAYVRKHVRVATIGNHVFYR